ncbi:ras-related protein Rab-13-like [Sycon ciliatum]|uniref:ras-related protein Rab-13-like n=1 Tax=Sycon ciliatum TaxID=27933 RepID=UPI0031F65720
MSARPKKYDHKFKVHLLGDQAVGKTSLLLRYAEERFYRTYDPTLNIDIKYRDVEYQGKRIRVELWDTIGQERFRSTISATLKDIDGVVLVYDVMDSESLVSLGQWIADVERRCGDVGRVMVGNKVDLEESSGDDITASAACELAVEKGIPLFKASAKSNHNVEHVFDELIQSILDCKAALGQSASRSFESSIVTLHEDPENQADVSNTVLSILRKCLC